MNRLKTLINELCPDGVDYVKIGDVVNYEQPAKYIVKSTDYSDKFDIPVLTAGQTFILGYTYEKNNIYQATKENPVIIFDDFTGAFKWVDFPFKVKSSAMKILTADEDKTFIRYIFHIMGKIGLSSDEHKRLWISIYSEFKIPLPPLDVQREIVRILDNFTTLKRELEKELDLRKKQYSYYRDMLLNFGDNVEYKTLGEIATIMRGASPRPIKYFVTDDINGIHWIKIGDVSPESKYITDTKERITVDGAKKSRFVHKGDFILSNSMSFGRPYILNIDGCIHDGWLSISDFEKYVLSDYLYYVLVSSPIQKEMHKKASFGGAVQNLNSDIVKSITIPVPPIKEQERIVKILDKFDSLCNDLTSGIPAEISARQKQYEYYRDKLLTFKELRT
ncbi:MAG: restriction endonuclease subunit S [Ruminococcus sp.]|nr:restriction endonuclease subunit S [Ruminococcus sp.]